MITKGIVIKRIEDSNKYLVRLPVFESFNNSSDTENLTNAALFEATLCYAPGNTDGIVPNDIVYVGFENNTYDQAIILGKLYLGDEGLATSHQNVNTLVVNGSAVLNGHVKINGLDFSTIDEHNQAINDLFGMADDQDSKWKKLRDWVIEADKDGLVLNFYREKK